MREELDALRRRVERLEAGVGEIRERLAACLQVASRPQDALALARGIAESLAKQVLERLGLKLATMLDGCLRLLEQPDVLSRGLVPAEVISLLHMVRVLGNKAAHDALRIEATATDVDLVVRSVLRVVEWYFAEFERGPRLDPLFKTGPSLPPLRADLPPLAVRLPPLVVVDEGEPPRKVFLFTERLLGMGREKPSRDPRVGIVTRLLPCPGPAHPNWNANLANISRFHAQLWWQVGRVEVRDEASDQGVFLNGHPIAPGLWSLCSLPDPAHIRLGPQGVELALSEVVRPVAGTPVFCVRLTRVDNWPFHDYVLLSHPAATIGSGRDCVAWFPHAPEWAAQVTTTSQRWAIQAADGSEAVVEAATAYPIPGTRLWLRRATEEDFLD
jgi:hypothetical protein